MNIPAIFHEPKSRWAYAYDSETLHLRLRTEKDDCRAIRVYAADPFNWSRQADGQYAYDVDRTVLKDMVREYSDEWYDYWFCAVNEISSSRIRYVFIIDGAVRTYIFSADGVRELANSETLAKDGNLYGFFNFAYINNEDIFSPPAWAAETVWYQIFPDRFCRGAESPPIDTSWDEEPEEIHHIFYGGNLAGIMEKLPYIRQLGMSGIYLTPLFVSSSVHKYDTTDYFKIDPGFGTNEQFGELVEKAHNLGLKVMLDAVFNHCGFEHPFFQDVIANGKKSKYWNCFCIQQEPVLNFELKNGFPPALTQEQQYNLPYRAFAYTPRMPKWNTEDPFTREYLISVGRFWIEQYGIDGWRLDVSDQVGHGFWRAFCHEMRLVKPEIFILGENWDDAMPWLRGDQFDSVMNFGFLRSVWPFLASDEKMWKSSEAEGFKNTIVSHLLASYPKNIQPYLFNILDCHDTPRIITICGENPDLAAIGYALLMTFAGSPCVYYGGEIGLGGQLKQDKNRRPMPWNQEQQNIALKDTIKKLVSLRMSHPSFRSVDVKWLTTDKKTIIYKKESENEQLYVFINASDRDTTVELPCELRNMSSLDLMTGEVKALGEIMTMKAFGFMLLMG